MGCAYLVRSPSGKGYVGITKHDVLTRWKVHVSEHRTSNWSALHDAIRKYGPEAFRVETLLESEDWEELLEVEKRLIAELGTKVPGGYNLTDGGEGCCNLEPEVLAARNAKIAAAARARWADPEFRARFKGMRGRKHTPEARANMSAAAKRRAFK